jgi:uncharacterized protein DUF190
VSRFFWICLGGAFGTGARYLVSGWALAVLGTIEVVDTPEHMERLLPILDGMVSEGLVTMETVRVLKYSPGQRPLET